MDPNEASISDKIAANISKFMNKIKSLRIMGWSIYTYLG
jgi:hypothetical protein